MTFNEKTLRDLMASPYGRTCGQAFIDSVDTGHVLTLHMSDGSEIVINRPAEARRILRERFGWEHQADPSN
jgi:hypothetical protein